MGKSIGGARAILLAGNVEVGYATGVSATETINQVPIEALGDAYVKEHELVGVVVSMSADFVRMKLASLQAQGFWPRGETIDLLAFNGTPLTWVLYDQVADRPIYKVEGVVAETRSWRLDRGSVLTTNASFRGIRMLDEVDAAGGTLAAGG